MEYTPEEIQGKGVIEKPVADATNLSAPALVRRLRISRAKQRGDLLLLVTPDIALPLAIPLSHPMTFGTETITAFDYFQQVIEEGDSIDAVLSPSGDGILPVDIYWIHIQYVGTPSEAGTFSKKEDGLFAMWTKSGEKAERVVTRKLSAEFGHSFPGSMLDSPGFFEIRYAGKKDRKPDRTCLACGMTFEIKKRNWDRHFRPSHSEGRPFMSENRPDGWHAFVFRDRSVHFISNAAIAQAIADGNYKAGKNQYDEWAQVDHLKPVDPPRCPGAL